MNRRLGILLGSLLLTVVPAWADDDSPHQMMKANGEVDKTQCEVCHEADDSLSRGKLDSCTLCHETTVHAGSAQHLAAPAERVAALAPKTPPKLPLEDNGTIYCGTCHIFHDPRAVPGETLLTDGWLPATSGPAGSIRTSVEKQLTEIRERYADKNPVAHFATRPVRALRLPVRDGALCRHCHGELP